jgi:hypothetical protein
MHLFTEYVPLLGTYNAHAIGFIVKAVRTNLYELRVVPLIMRGLERSLFVSQLAGSEMKLNRSVLTLKMTIFSDVAPYSLADIDRRFRGIYRLHWQMLTDVSEELTSSII